ncbi:MAG TPA: tripartite tricarboxylate transporter TctB family protein [Firmicutes bacterium]|nr:tripartite tricarboxylate transporter TctB family protein [Bacillota bacterium]
MMRREKSLLFLPHIFLAVVVVAIFYSLVILMQKANIQIFDITSPLIFCFLVGICLLVFLVLSFLSDYRKKADDAEKRSAAVENEEFKRIILYLLGLVVYIVLLPRLHFTAATMIFMAVGGYALHDGGKTTTRLLQAVLAAAILVPAVYYIFYGIFAVMLP